MTNTSLFPGDTGDDAPLIDADKDYHAELVGEGKKFKDDAALAKGKAESDAFILRQQKELAGLRDELKTRVSLQEFMDKMDTTKINTPAITQGSPDPDQRGDQPKTLTAADIEQLLTNREQQKIQAENQANIRQKLIEVLGPNYGPELKKRQEASGYDQDFLDDLAKKKPGAFLKLLDIDTPVQKDSVFAPPNSSVRAVPPIGNDKNWKFYENMRKTNPTKYWESATQNEMHRQAEKYRENFYS